MIFLGYDKGRSNEGSAAKEEGSANRHGWTGNQSDKKELVAMIAL